MHYGRNRNFLAYEEAAEWFDTHDMADYEDQLTPVEVEFDLRKNQNWVELGGKIAKYHLLRSRPMFSPLANVPSPE